MSAVIIVTEADAAILAMMRLNDPLRRELARAVVVSSEAVPPDVATMNSMIRYVDETSGEQRTVFLVHPEKADGSAGKLSVLAPVGTALLGLSEGQAIDWDFPDGSRRRLRLLEVVWQPERLSNSPSPRAP